MIAPKKGIHMAEEKVKVVKKRPTALKRDIQNEKKRLINKAFKSKVRTTQRDFQESLKGSDREAVATHLSAFYSMMDKGVKRGIYTRNKAGRSKMRAQKRVASFLN